MSGDILDPPPAFVALDLSLTSTGIADTAGVRSIKVRLPKRASDLQQMRRLHELAEIIDEQTCDASLVIIEGHAFSRGGRGGDGAFSHAHSLGELHGVCKVIWLQREIPVAIVPPTSLKKYALGKGGGEGATKQAMLAAAARRCQYPFEDFDQSDAWWLLQMAYAHYGHPWRIVMPQENDKGLAGVQWPEVEL